MRVREFDAIADVIAGRLSKVAGVVHTDTHIAFRAYSRHDLESTFSHRHRVALGRLVRVRSSRASQSL